MKKIGLLVFAVCLTIATQAQNTVDIFSTGALGSYTTGNTTTSTRSDNSIVCTNLPPNPTRGYAVFDLASIPATASITNVELHFNVEGYVPGLGMGSQTRGVAGDLSLITAPATLYTTMSLPINPIIYTAPYAFGTGNQLLISEATAVSFIAANIGTKVSIVWIIPTATRVYTITGETGVASTSGVHAPYLRITYDCPAITAISADGPLVPPCPNTAFTLNGAVTGATDYLWTGPLGFSSTMANPTVTSGLPSTGLYTFTATDPSGCVARAIATVAVNPAPDATVTPLTSAAFCAGDNAILDAPVVAGHAYQWYNGTTLIAGATDAAYTADTTGTYSVRIVDANGCIGMTDPGFAVVELDNPDVNPGDSVLLCSGDNGTITVNTNGVTSGLTFQWQKDGVNIPGAVSNSYVVTASGVYRNIVSVTSTPCVATSKPIVVDVNDYPLPTVAYSGAAVSTANVYANYQWFLNTVAIPGATNYSLVPSSPGSYRVRVTDANGCTAFSGAYNINVVGVTDITAASIKLHPNPASTTVNIESPVTVKAVLSSMDGKVIGTYINAQKIDISKLATGLYFVTLYNEAGDRIMVEKITKQ